LRPKGLVRRWRLHISLTDRRSPPEGRIARAMDADPLLQLSAVEATRPGARGRRDRRSALRAEGRRRRRAMAGRTSDLARERGRHTAAGYMSTADRCQRAPYTWIADGL